MQPMVYLWYTYGIKNKKKFLKMSPWHATYGVPMVYLWYKK